MGTPSAVKIQMMAELYASVRPCDGADTEASTSEVAGLPSADCNRLAADTIATPPMTAETLGPHALDNIMVQDICSTPATGSTCHSPLNGSRVSVTTQVRLIQDEPCIRGEPSVVECLLSKKDLAPFGKE